MNESGVVFCEVRHLGSSPLRTGDKNVSGKKAEFLQTIRTAESLVGGRFYLQFVERLCLGERPARISPGIGKTPVSPGISTR